MPKEDNNNYIKRLSAWGTILFGIPWPEIIGELWKFGRKVIRGLSHEGMYEVLAYETTLELHDRKGKKATLKKCEKVRYLQDNIVAYQDQAWGDGEILIDYRCTPGMPVDRYQPGKKIYILISLREVKHRGDVDVFNIEWGIRDGFLREKELWETEIRHRTKRLKIQVIFPKNRPPRSLSLVEEMRQRTRSLGSSAKTKLPDGRWLVSWEIERPRLYERYSIQWEW
jgi:hypothetical protein